MRRQQAAKVESALRLIGPMGEMIEKQQQVISAHHPAGHDANDCPVCAEHLDEMRDILERWSDVRAVVLEHWDV